MITAQDIRLALAEQLLSGKRFAWAELTEAVTDELELADWRRVSTALKWMSRQKLVSSVKSGRHWHVQATPELERWVNQETSPPDDELKPVRITHQGRIPRNLWAEYMKAFQAGEMDVVFIPSASRVVAFKDPTTNQTMKVERYGPPEDES